MNNGRKTVLLVVKKKSFAFLLSNYIGGIVDRKIFICYNFGVTTTERWKKDENKRCCEKETQSQSKGILQTDFGIAHR